MRISDWSSDVCSSDLLADAARIAHQFVTETGQHDNDVWLETARILVANMLRELWQQGAPSLSDLLAMFQISTKEELKERLKNTSSARTFAEDADRATGKIGRASCRERGCQDV